MIFLYCVSGSALLHLQHVKDKHAAVWCNKSCRESEEIQKQQKYVVLSCFPLARDFMRAMIESYDHLPGWKILLQSQTMKFKTAYVWNSTDRIRTMKMESTKQHIWTVSHLAGLWTHFCFFLRLQIFNLICVWLVYVSGTHRDFFLVINNVNLISCIYSIDCWLNVPI